MRISSGSVLSALVEPGLAAAASAAPAELSIRLPVRAKRAPSERASERSAGRFELFDPEVMKVLSSQLVEILELASCVVRQLFPISFDLRSNLIVPNHEASFLCLRIDGEERLGSLAQPRLI